MDAERGMRTIPPRMKRDHLLIARYNDGAKKIDRESKWSGYADPIKQAMADAGLIPQSPAIGETVDARGFVKSKGSSPRDEKLYRGKDNGKPRGDENIVQCTSSANPTPIVVGSQWPRGKDGEIRPIYAPRETVELGYTPDAPDATLFGKAKIVAYEEFRKELFDIARKGKYARKGK